MKEYNNIPNDSVEKNEKEKYITAIDIYLLCQSRRLRKAGILPNEGMTSLLNWNKACKKGDIDREALSLSDLKKKENW